MKLLITFEQRMRLALEAKYASVIDRCYSEHETCFNCPIIHFTASQVKMNSKSSISPTKCISSGC